MKVAMCKLELCRRDQKFGGGGQLPRVIPASPSERTVRFVFDGKEYKDQLTTFDASALYGPVPSVPFQLPDGPVTLLSNRELVNKAILSWNSDNHIGTDLSLIASIALMGGHFALLMWAWSVGIALFVYIASLLLGIGIPISTIAMIAGSGFFIGAAFGLVSAVACYEKGDYDMSMMGLFPIIYRYGKLLDKDSYDHILHKLLRKHVSGGANKVHEVDHVCGKKVLSFLPKNWIGETENHILMIETARFLTNQLLLLPNPVAVPSVTPPYDPAFDNSVNGMRQWMLNHLQKYLQNDFWEFNSRIYSRFVALALQNLYEFSADPDVKKAAKIVLDYLSAKFAVTSNGSRRAGPFRRHNDNRDKSPLFDEFSDAETWRFLMLTGDALMLGSLPPGKEEEILGKESYTLVTAALGRYRVPELLLDLMLMPEATPPATSLPNRYLQLIRHGAWDHGYGDPAMEITFSSNKYLITGGGIFANARGDEEAWALPTNLMLTAPNATRSSDWRDFIRIEGTVEEKARANTGVAPGFACGLNPRIPDWILELKMRGNPSLIETTHTNWTFINFACNEFPFGVYVVVFEKKCDSELSRVFAGQHGKFGFFAVVEVEMVDQDNHFTSFKSDVLSLNSSKTYTAEGINNFLFPTGLGGDIDFVCLPTQNGNYEPLLWTIVKINGKAVGRNINNWDLATSSLFSPDGQQTSLEDWIIRSEKHFGCVMVDNPRLDHRLVLDLSDAMNPRTAYVMDHRFDSGCRCPLSKECERKHPIK
ncbi:MAG TPA: hypothetical protein VGJ48_08065 [Pyrinomonadaceae bacterium]